MTARFAKLRASSKSKSTSIVFLPVFLALAGLLFVFESSSVRAVNEFGDSFHYFKVQAVWIVLGMIGMFFLSFFDYKKHVFNGRKVKAVEIIHHNDYFFIKISKRIAQIIERIINCVVAWI